MSIFQIWDTALTIFIHHAVVAIKQKSNITYVKTSSMTMVQQKRKVLTS